jgi:hypothetical protein
MGVAPERHGLQQYVWGRTASASQSSGTRVISTTCGSPSFQRRRGTVILIVDERGSSSSSSAIFCLARLARFFPFFFPSASE